MIEVHNLTKFYGASAAVRDVSFTVATGEILGFLGPNGAGKTTTMRILAGCLAATSGAASIAGFDVFEQSIEARASLGYLPEQVPLYPEMTVDEYLAFAAALHGMQGAAIRKRIGEVCGRCGLGDVRRKLIGRLSKGYRQRVGLAQALIHNPPVLILDEPTVGLDPRQIIEVRELIRGLAGDHTVLLSTHILPEVSIVCSRVAIIHRGRVVAQDTLESLTGGAGDRLVVAVDCSAEQAAGLLRSVPGVLEVAARDGRSGGVPAALEIRVSAGDPEQSARVRRSVSEALVRGRCGLLEMRLERRSLEETFVRLTTAETV